MFLDMKMKLGGLYAQDNTAKLHRELVGEISDPMVSLLVQCPVYSTYVEGVEYMVSCLTNFKDFEIEINNINEFFNHRNYFVFLNELEIA